jgi:PPOX class probable F420-dependent enzyme
MRDIVCPAGATVWAMTVSPRPSRPYMPDYGILPANEGSGLLDWSWAEQQLRASRNFWVATRWPDGRPHVMPVWAVWDGDAIWFSGGLHSRKVRNVRADPRCTLSTEDAASPVVVEGVASKIDEVDLKQAFLDLVNAKYDTNYELTFLDPATTAVLRVAPMWAFAIREEDFSGSPTRWSFDS